MPGWVKYSAFGEVDHLAAGRHWVNSLLGWKYARTTGSPISSVARYNNICQCLRTGAEPCNGSGPLHRVTTGSRAAEWGR